MFKGEGKIEYRNSWIVMILHPSIGQYYKWWIEKTLHKKVNTPMHGWHVTVVAGKYEDKTSHPLWKKHDNVNVEFEYDHNIEDDQTTYWLPIKSRDLETIRVELDLWPFPKWPFHCTIGNLKKLISNSMNSDTRLIYEAYTNPYQNKGQGALKQFIEWYEKRTEELAAANGHEGSATGEFMFDISENNVLHVSCDVIHTDTVLNSITDPNFDVNNFSLGRYAIPYVHHALEENGVKSISGLVHTGSVSLLGFPVPGTVSINTYTGDTITVQMDIPDIQNVFQNKKQELVKVLDTFIAKMFATINTLNTKYFKPVPVECFKVGEYNVPQIREILQHFTGRVKVIKKEGKYAFVPLIEDKDGDWTELWNFKGSRKVIDELYDILHVNLPKQMI